MGDAPVFIHGGGFIGSLWENENSTISLILRTFKNNRIVVLPQSIFYNDEEIERTFCGIDDAF